MSRAPTVVAVLLVLVAGCGDLGAGDGATCFDDEPCPGSVDDDAGWPDAGLGGDAAGPRGVPRGIPASPDDGSFAGESPSADVHDPATCYDGIDNDATGALDCADPGCASLGACCVGSGDCCASVSSPPLPSAITLPESCPGDPTAGCLAGVDVTAFGDPGPRVVEGVLYPGGDASYDSGLLIGDAVDLSAMRVRVETSFHAPTDCGATCLEGAGIAFTEQQTFGDSTFVRPLVGLLSSGSRRDVRLVVADTAVASWPLADGEGPYELVLQPDGTVEVRRDGTSLHTAWFPTTAAAHLVVYGRNRNPSAADPNGSGVRDITMTVELCDMPAAWRVREELFVAQPPTMAELDTGRMRAPSVAEDASGRLALVFEDGDIFRAAQRGGEPHRFTMVGDVAFQPGGELWFEGGISDPELLWDGARWELFFTAIDSDGKPSIGRASTGDLATGFAGAVQMLPRDEGVDGYSMPTVIRLWYDTTTWILVVRADLTDGTHELRTFVSNDGGASFQRFADDLLPGLTRRGGPESRGGFDADEVAAPSILVHNGAYHLYYAGRRGTRWRIGMLASDELVYWRVVNEGAAILEGDGNGLDRLGASDPDVVVQGITVELFYTGTDGARDTLFRGVRSAAEEASR